MSVTAFILIIFSVLFHAAWNLLAKKNEMSVTFYTLLCYGATLCSHSTIYWTPVEYSTLPWTFYLCMLAAVISDCTYCFGLTGAYRRMDMSSAYPLMRALPLLLTMGVTSLCSWGNTLPWYSICGMIMAFAGCMLLPLKRIRDFSLKNYLSPHIFFIFLAACGTTGYTVFDSQAQKILRAAVNPEMSRVVTSLSYYAVRGIFLCTMLNLITLSIPGERRKFLDFWEKPNIQPFIGGISAAFAYATVLIAMNFVSNVTYVQALRLLALPLGVFTGIFFLKERGSVPKFTGVILVLAGLLLSFI